MYWHRRISALVAAAALASGCAGLDPSGTGESASARAEQSAFDDAVALMREGRYEQAAVAWERLLNNDPKQTDALGNLAIAYMELGRQEDAIEALSKALAEDPAHPEAATLMAIEAREAGRFEEARALYTGVLQAHPDYALGHLNLGILCDLYLHEPDCALEHYQRYQQLTQGEEQEVAAWIADLEQRLQ